MICDPFEFQSGQLPLLISIPHAGTRLTPAVEKGLTDEARPCKTPTGISHGCTILPVPWGPASWSVTIRAW